jgi:hypothetical protein
MLWTWTLQENITIAVDLSFDAKFCDAGPNTKLHVPGFSEFDTDELAFPHLHDTFWSTKTPKHVLSPTLNWATDK